MIDIDQIEKVIKDTQPSFIPKWVQIKNVLVSEKHNITVDDLRRSMEQVASADQVLSIRRAPRKSLHGGAPIDG